SKLRAVAIRRALLLRADPADALDLERRPAAFFGDFAILLVDEPAGRLVAVEAAEQLGRHAAGGAVGGVLVDDVKEGKFAFGIGSGLFRHARLLVDERPSVKRNRAVAPSITAQTIAAIRNCVRPRPYANLPPEEGVVYEGFCRRNAGRI